MKIEESTLFVRNQLKLYWALSLKLFDKFSPTFEKKTLNLLINYLLLVTYAATIKIDIRW